MEKYRKILYMGASIVALFVISFIFIRYALPIFIPFGISFFIAVISRPLIDRICRSTNLNKSVVSVVVMFLLLFVTVYIIFVAASAAITQLGNLLNEISVHLSREDNYITNLFSLIESLKIRFPFLNNSILGGEDTVYSMAVEMISEGIKSYSLKITSSLASLIASLPSLVITAAAVILSLFYFSKDYDSIMEYLRASLPKGVKEKMKIVKRDVVSIALKYLRSYFLLLLITFAELFAGFLILKIENAFVLAAIIALVDMLPVLGVGVVLVPWAVILFIGGNTPLAMGMLILYVAIYFLRQIEEPRIIGKQMNVHPLFALVTMYAGLKLAGLWGMILGPFIAFIIKTLYESFKNKKDIENTEKL